MKTKLAGKKRRLARARSLVGRRAVEERGRKKREEMTVKGCRARKKTLVGPKRIYAGRGDVTLARILLNAPKADQQQYKVNITRGLYINLGFPKDFVECSFHRKVKV